MYRFYLVAFCVVHNGLIFPNTPDRLQQKKSLIEVIWFIMIWDWVYLSDQVLLMGSYLFRHYSGFATPKGDEKLWSCTVHKHHSLPYAKRNSQPFLASWNWVEYVYILNIYTHTYTYICVCSHWMSTWNPMLFIDMLFQIWPFLPSPFFYSSDQDPKLRLNLFFSSLYTVLKKDARAVLQFYPESAEQAVLISQCASKVFVVKTVQLILYIHITAVQVGFSGGLVVDYPNSAKSKKFYLCLSFERSFRMPTARGVETTSTTVESVVRSSVGGGRWAFFCSVIAIASWTSSVRSSPWTLFCPSSIASDDIWCLSYDFYRHERKAKKSNRNVGKTKDWIVQKKERYKRQGKEVKADSKFTGRRRAMGF